MADPFRVPDVSRRVTLTPRELAELTGIPQPTIYRWIACGRLPARKIGKRLLLPTQQVLDILLAAGSSGNGGEGGRGA